MIKWATIALIVVLAQFQAPAQEKRFLIYDTEDGLSNNSVHTIIRTRDGLVWAGTQDGLCSFDGNHFNVYKHNEADSNSISDQFVLCIEEDKLGNLWVGTRSGLNYFNRKTRRFKRFYMDENEKHVFQSSYESLLLQNDNKLILKNDILVLLDAASGKKIELGNKKKEGIIEWIIQPDYSGWSLNSNNSVSYFADIRNKKSTATGIHSFAFNQKISVLKQLSLNDSITLLYNFNQSDTLYFFNRRLHSITHKKPVLPGSFDICKSKNKYFLCNSNGLYETDINGSMLWSAVPATVSNGLPPSGFLCAYADKEGNIWLGSSSSGIVVNNPNFELFTSIPTLIPNERINGIAVTGNTLYAGTYSGLYRIADLSKTTLQFEKMLPGKFISAVATDKDNNIWAAVLNAGILVVSPSGKIIRNLSLPGPDMRKTVFHMMADKTGKILISTSKGFFIADPAKNNTISSIDTSGKNKLANYYVMSSFQDTRKKIWLAGYHGIDVLDEFMLPEKSFKSFRDDQSFLQRTIITSITQDRQDVMWIATIRNGVYRYSGNSITHYTINDGLSSDITYNIMCDNNDRIWVCTSAGLNIYDKAEKTFRSIPAFDGISKTAFSLGSFARYKNKLIFGANGKILVVDADNYVIKKEKLDAYISDVKINGQSTNIINNTLTVTPDNKIIQFDFAYLPGFYSGNIIYQYRMQGIDSTWTTLTPGASSISYTGLPYKKLLMQVRAAGAFNTLTKAPVFSLAINSSPPFFKSAWFMIAAAIFLVACGFILLALYNRQKYKKQLQALKMEKELHRERSRIGRDLHDNIGAYTSALIAGLNRIKPTDSIHDNTITDLKDYGSSIMGLLRETIWMLNAEELTVTAFADRFINYAMRINKNYPEIDFSFEENIANDKKLQPTIMLNLFRILQEALQNACKHSAADKINILITSDSNLQFLIADNGKGFDGNKAKDHYGIDNMRERAIEAGFLLTIESNSSAGTKVMLTQNTANV